MLLPFAIMVGSPVVIMPQYEPDAFCRNIEKYKVTVALIVPPVCLAILHHPGKCSCWSPVFLANGCSFSYE